MPHFLTLWQNRNGKTAGKLALGHIHSNLFPPPSPTPVLLRQHYQIGASCSTTQAHGGHFTFTITTVSPSHLHLRKSPCLPRHPCSIPFWCPWTWAFEQYINNGPLNQSEVKSHGVNHKSHVRSTPFWESDPESRGVNS